MKKNIALVLSGGAARGIAHIGVIEELIENGFVISSIAGNSMGAFVGAIYALGKIDEFKHWICSLDKTDVLSLIDFSFDGMGFIKGNKIFKKIKNFIPDKNIEDLEIPYVAVSSDLYSMQEYVFSKGSIFDAVRASISIPTIFAPVKYGDKLLVDGGLVNPIPLNIVERNNNDLLVAVHVNADISCDYTIENDVDYYKKINDFKVYLNKIITKKNKEKFNYFSILNKSSMLLTYSLSTMIIEKYPPDILIEISRDAAGNFDFFKASKLIKIGRLAAKKALSNFTKIKKNET
jgi:NTE family protein